uniref:IncH1 plasmid conjugative transfer protein TrhZ n=1 Tax=Salmonella enteritidis TaxID=149539 RepID=A0A1S6KRR4_SALEN|nr:IncH1 plasmid conjugative transfer protein TrhZ [Salmonella enterica subsp. enterica serovar Enteritidis]
MRIIYEKNINCYFIMFLSLSFSISIPYLYCPGRALVKNILTNEYLGKTPVVVDVSNTEAGSTFGISLFRHENVAIKIFTVMPSAENNFAVSGPDVATMSLPGKAPLNVVNDGNGASVHIELRPYMSEPAHTPY